MIGDETVRLAVVGGRSRGTRKRAGAASRRRIVVAVICRSLLLLGVVAGGGWYLYQSIVDHPRLRRATARATSSSRCTTATPPARSARARPAGRGGRAARPSPRRPRPTATGSAPSSPATTSCAAHVRRGGGGPAAGSGVAGRSAGDPRWRPARRHQRPRRHGHPRRADPDLPGHLRDGRRRRRCVSVDELRTAMADTDPAQLGVPSGRWPTSQADAEPPAGGPARARPLRRRAPACRPSTCCAACSTPRPTRLEASGLVAGAQSVGDIAVPGADHLLAGREGGDHRGHGQGRPGDLQPARRGPAARARLHGQLPAGPAVAPHEPRPGQARPVQQLPRHRAAADADRSGRVGTRSPPRWRPPPAPGCTSCAARPTAPPASRTRSPSTTPTWPRPARTARSSRDRPARQPRRCGARAATGHGPSGRCGPPR